MVEVTPRHKSIGEYELSPSFINEEGSYGPEVQSSDYEHSETQQDAALRRMKKLAQKIYDTTPGINDGMLRSFIVLIDLFVIDSLPEKVIKNSRWHQARGRSRRKSCPQIHREVRIN